MDSQIVAAYIGLTGVGVALFSGVAYFENESRAKSNYKEDFALAFRG